MSGFVNHWHVTEHVFDTDGRFIGVIEQRRMLEPGGGRTRITQVCTPRLDDPSHVMNRFAGEWVFDIEREGRVRRYHGPDVFGTGLGWGDSVITGRGVWPRFGCNFVSYGVLSGPNRQLTGGTFFNGDAPVATIIGVAVAGTDQFPILSLDGRPADIATHWHGTEVVFDMDGRCLEQTVITRSAQDFERIEQTGRAFGCARSAARADAHTHQEALAIYDARGRHWVELIQRWRDGLFAGLTVRQTEPLIGDSAAVDRSNTP
jgi:hypothetical protein